MSDLQRRSQTSVYRPTNITTRMALATIGALGDIERQVAEVGHAVVTDMKITELIAEAEIAQDRLDRKGRIR